MFGEIYYADLQTDESIQGGLRPVIIAQNNAGNKFSGTVGIIPLTSRIKATHLPTHIIIPANSVNGLLCDSMALVEQTTTIPKTRLKTRLGILDKTVLVALGKAHQVEFPFPTK
ncbi:MAG TPA: type II toxin-antitoxin system PemK/MazF family toxin [Saprospiraceae bacterium]|nr:type II toxin-antitoxin system PemK/MazF family toxin [Saprospiraceae bacterium]